MRRLIRPALFTVISISAVAAFVLLGGASPEPVTVDDIAGWLDRVEPVDALAEIARGVGLVLAVYVAAVSVTALVAELAAALRFPRLHRWLVRLARSVAVPALRHRLLEVTTAATITASALHVTPAGASIAPAASAAVMVDSIPITADRPAIRGEFEGFGVLTRGMPASAEGDVHVVVEGDTLWDIVEHHYGRVDADLVGAVVQANPMIRDADLILVGWELQFPEIEPPVAEPTETRDVDGEATWTVMTVNRGDTLWDIVDRHYGQATGELVWRTVDANPDIENPDLIYAGQQITLPPADGVPGSSPDPTLAQIDEPQDGPPAMPTSPALSATPESPEPAAPSPAPTTAAPQSPVAPSTTTAEVVATTTPDAVADPVLENPAAASDASGARPIDADVGGEVDEIADSPPLATILGWTGGAGLAAAIIGLIARRRRRRAPTDRHRVPTRRAIEAEVALRETENLTEAELAAEGLRQLAAHIRPRPGEPTPVPRLLRLGTDDIELVWDAPNTEVIAPWSTGDGGWSWTLDCTAVPPRSERPNPCPGFVTIGHRDASDVLLNLESCGAISVTGDPQERDAVITALALEFAASAFADFPTVLLVGRDPLPARPEHARVVSAAEAAGWLRDRTEAAAALLAQRRLTSLFALRARSRPEDSHEPVVAIVDAGSVDDVTLESLIDLANGDLGAVVVVAGSHPSISWRLTCNAGDVTLEPLGLILDELGISSDFAELVDDVVPEADADDDPDAVDEPEADEIPAMLTDHVALAHERLPVLSSEANDAVSELPDWDVELKVVGQVGVEGLEEQLTPTELHLAIYLAFHRRGENGDTIATMVWPNGVAGKTVANNLAGLRRKLGPGADGEMLLPLARETQHVYRLSRRVTTDWERFVALTNKANGVPDDEAVHLLDEALALVNGPPFRAQAGYSWAYSDGTATLITETIALAARRCVDLHIERSELAEAVEAARRASQLDNPESDALMSTVATARQVTKSESGSVARTRRCEADGG